MIVFSLPWGWPVWEHNWPCHRSTLCPWGRVPRRWPGGQCRPTRTGTCGCSDQAGRGSPAAGDLSTRGQKDALGPQKACREEGGVQWRSKIGWKPCTSTGHSAVINSVRSCHFLQNLSNHYSLMTTNRPQLTFLFSVIKDKNEKFLLTTKSKYIKTKK